MGGKRMSLRCCAMILMLIHLPLSLAAVDVPADFTTKVARHVPLRLHYPPHLAKMAGAVEEIVDQAVWEIAGDVGLEAIDTLHVMLAPNDESYRRLHRGLLPEWSAAFSDRRFQIIGINVPAVLRVPRPLKTVVRHELSHLLLAQRLAGTPCPRWFVEGLAMIHSHEWSFSDQWNLMRAIWRKRMPYLDELAGPFPASPEEAALAYRISFVAVDMLFRDRRQDLITLTAFARDLGDFDRAFMSTFGETTDEYSARLYSLLANKYRPASAFVQGAPYWLGLALLFIVAYVIKRRRGRKKLEGWLED